MADKGKGVKQLYYDGKLLFPVLFLVGIGIVMVYSASSALALKKYGTDYYFLKKQALFSLVGIIALVACRHVPYHFWRSLTYPLVVLSLFLLVIIQVTDLGFSAGGSTRWLRLGDFSFQPSEFARFSLVLFLAYSLEKKKNHLREFYIGFLPHLIVMILFAVLILLEPDFGSVVILAALTWMLLFVGGVRILHLTSCLVLLLPVLYFFMVNAEYRLKRFLSFLNPWEYPADEGYQIVHSLMAFGTGGIWGQGIGKGYQKLFYLPEPHTDFIFSVIGEELGLVGVFITLGLYLLIILRGIIISRNTQDTFGSLVAMGLTIALGLQVVTNMGVSLGLLPTKGLPLPFLSYGGTSLLMSMASIGIILNIGSSNYRK